jgi:recombination protein RecT
VMRDGAVSKVVVMSRAEIETHRKASKAGNAKDGPWQRWPDAMALKTVVRQLEKWVPTSSQFRREQLRAAMQAQRFRDTTVTQTEAGPVDVDTGEVHDAEVVPDDGSAGESHTAGVDTPPADPEAGR